jgi:hypothetical protein
VAVLGKGYSFGIWTKLDGIAIFSVRFRLFSGNSGRNLKIRLKKPRKKQSTLPKQWLSFPYMVSRLKNRPCWLLAGAAELHLGPQEPLELKLLRRSTKTPILSRFPHFWDAVYKPVYKHPVYKPKLKNRL